MLTATSVNLSMGFGGSSGFPACSSNDTFEGRMARSIPAGPSWNPFGPQKDPVTRSFPTSGNRRPWYRKTTLDDPLGVPLDKAQTDRLYAGLDRVYSHKESIEKHLRHRTGGLFEAEFEVLIYDLTSTNFGGKAVGNTKAAPGYSQDNSSDCNQVCIGRVVTPGGFPVAHEVFEGNRSNSKTLRDMVESVEQKHGKIGRVWVLDRGMASGRISRFCVRGAFLYRLHAQSHTQAV